MSQGTSKGMSKASGKASSGEVRIVGGLWKRTKLPVAHFPGLRPTPDRVRETLFNWLGQDLTGWRCVDAFAGTGALGFEAASRGAENVLMCEKQAALVTQLQAIADKLGASKVTIERGDGVALLKRIATKSMDLVLLDPPFEAVGMEAAALAAASFVLAEEGYIYLESPQSLSAHDAELLGLQIYRSGKAGMVHYHLLQKIPNTLNLG